jgi:hypothetical protein
MLITMEKYLESTLDTFADVIKPEDLAFRFRQMILGITIFHTSPGGEPLYTQRQLEHAADNDQTDTGLLFLVNELKERALFEVSLEDLNEDGNDDDWDLDEELKEFTEADDVGTGSKFEKWEI